MKISLKLWRQSVLRSSQPMPPAPMRRARVLLKSILSGDVKRRAMLKGVAGTCDKSEGNAQKTACWKATALGRGCVRSTNLGDRQQSLRSEIMQTWWSLSHQERSRRLTVQYYILSNSKF